MTESPSTPAGEHDRISSMLWYFLRMEAVDRAATLDGAARWIAGALRGQADIVLADPATDALTVAASSDGVLPLGGEPPAAPLLREALRGERPCRLAEQAGAAPFSVLVPLAVNGRAAGLLCLRGGDGAADTLLHAYALGLAGLIQRLEAAAAPRGHSGSPGAGPGGEAERHRTFDELAGMLVHDLGNYIAPLQGRIELMERRASRESRERDLRDIQIAAETTQRLQRVLRMLGDSSRVRHNALPLKREPLDLAALAADVAHQAGTDAGPVTFAADGPVPVEADPQYLRQALDSLLRAALALAAPGAAVDFRVSARRDGERALAVAELLSPGDGISARNMPGFFSRFLVHSQGKMGGLALYMARGVAEAHGGDVTAATAPGQGATLTLTLPALG